MIRNEMVEIIKNYFSQSDIKLDPVPFGLTNTTYKVSIDNKPYIVRKYDKQVKSMESVQLEKNVTSFLQQCNLSFQIPQFLTTLNGKDVVYLDDGSIGVMVTYIEGSIPFIKSDADAFLFGKTVGELSAALSQFTFADQSHHKGIPFTQIYKLHKQLSVHHVKQFIEQATFITPNQKDYYTQVINDVKSNLHLLDAFPRQFVHHDLLVYNLLAVNQVITGVLDFDFLSYDIAFLEFAISLNHLLQLTNGSIEHARTFIKGYRMFRTLSAVEVNHLRLLTRLYHITVLHIYIGQSVSGKEVTQPFIYIINQLIERDKWLEAHEHELKTMFSAF